MRDSVNAFIALDGHIFPHFSTTHEDRQKTRKVRLTQWMHSLNLLKQQQKNFKQRVRINSVHKWDVKLKQLVRKDVEFKQLSS